MTGVGILNTIVGIIAVISILRYMKKRVSTNKGKVPSQEAVVKRALCVSVLVRRFEIEMLFQSVKRSLANSGKDDLNKTHEKAGQEAVISLKNWIKLAKIDSGFSPKEKILMGKALGSWSQRELINSGWRKEALGVLLWSLSFVDTMPEYDCEFDEIGLMDKVFKIGRKEFEAKAKLRPAEEIIKAREIAEHWHWRSRTTQLINEGKVTPPKDLSFDEIIEKSAEYGYKDGVNPKPISKDFPALGKPYRDLTTDEYNTVTSIAVERHFSLNWLCGYSPSWDDTPTDT